MSEIEIFLSIVISLLNIIAFFACKKEKDECAKIKDSIVSISDSFNRKSSIKSNDSFNISKVNTFDNSKKIGD